MEFRILGPLQVWRDRRRVSPGGPQAEKALAALLLAGGRVVPLDALIEALWEHDPPPTARHQVHKVVAGLRRVLPGLVETDGRGYRVRLEVADLDARTFADLAASPSIPGLTAALDLWRGPALAGIDSRPVRAAAAALDERRLAVLEALADLRLAAGEAAAVAAELPAVVAAHPLRETLRARLMTALARCGRQAEALAVYAETRALLAEELGADPGPELARLHERLLRADPELATGLAGPGLAGPVRAVPCSLPYDLPDFAGRHTDLDRLLTAAGAVMINAVDGMAGVGKTALAVHAAHRLAARYPDGQLFFDLHGHTPGARPVEPAVALDRLLRMFGVPPQAIPEGLDQRAARWRQELAGRRVLLVLDNAATAAQVRPLLPGAPGCLALVTSRGRLAGLDGATVLSLDVLPPAEAVELFAAVTGADRAAAEPAAVAEVVELCGHLPLAIRIAATRLAHRPRWTVAALAGRLRTQARRLAELTVADRGVAPAFALSYRALPASGRRMFRLLGRHPGPDFDARAAAALAAVPVERAEAELEALVDAHLLGYSAARPGSPALPDRYTFHDLLREYARELGAAEGSEPARRLYGYYLAAAEAATRLVSPDALAHAAAGADAADAAGAAGAPVVAGAPGVAGAPSAGGADGSEGSPAAPVPAFADLPAALAWLTAEHQALVALAIAGPDWRLACALRAYFEHRGHFADWRRTHEAALRAADGDPRGQVMIRFNLGALAMWTDRLTEGIGHFQHVLAGDLADPRLEATALTSLGMLEHLLNRDVEAAAHLRQALSIEHDSPRVTALGWNNLGLAEGRLGLRDAALAHHRRALRLARRAGSASAERGILLGLGETSLRLGRPATEPFRRALAMARAGRFRMQEALALDGLAHATGEPGPWYEALAIYTELGVRRADLVRRHLENPGTSCCDLCRAAPRVGAARSG